MNNKDIRTVIKMIRNTLKANPTSSTKSLLADIKKYYSDEQFANMLFEIENIDANDKVAYSYINDIIDDIKQYTTLLKDKPTFEIFSTSEYNAGEYYSRKEKIIGFDFGLLWFVQNMSDIIIKYLIETVKGNYNHVKQVISMVTDLVITLKKREIHKIKQMPMTRSEFILSSYLQYSFTVFVCLHEIIHLIRNHRVEDIEQLRENEINADIEAYKNALIVVKNKLGDNRILLVGIISFFQILELIEVEQEQVSVHPSYSERFELIKDLFVPENLVINKKSLVNILFIEKTDTYSLNSIYNDIHALCHFCREIINILETENNYEE